MERDFMGLTVKQETCEEEPIDAAPLRSTAMHWPFSSKGPGAIPQFLSFLDESPKTGFDSLVSTGLVSLTTTEGFDSGHKSCAIAQKNVVSEKQGRVPYTVTTYPARHGVQRAVAVQTNAAVSPTSGSNLIGSIGLSAQPLAGVPLANPIMAAPGVPIFGSTDLRNSPKLSGGAAQLTIFYNGSVCVYDNILPEKAQAIMLLAGHGPSLTSSTTPTAAPAQASTPVPSVLDKFVMTQPYGTPPHRSTPVPVATTAVSQSAAKPAGVVISSSKFAEPLKVGSTVGPVPATFLSQGTVPQFRKKSLARFLEKRRERAMMSSASPYSAKDSPGTPGLSANSSGSCPVPAIN